MIKSIKWLLIIFFLSGVLMGALAVSSLDDRPIIPGQAAPLSDSQLQRVKRLLRVNSPRQIRPGELNQQRLSQQDINLILNYVGEKARYSLHRQLAGRVTVEENQARLELSIQLLQNPAKYVNISGLLRARQDARGQHLQLASLSIGRLPVTTQIADALLQFVHHRLLAQVPEYRLLNESVKRLEFQPEQLVIHYIWDQQTEASIRSGLSSRIISAELKQALLAQARQLAQTSGMLSSRPGLSELMQPLFALARQRSREGNPIVENQAVLISLGGYALKRNMAEILGEQNPPRISYRRIYLQGRHDLSKHLMLSAAITSVSDAQLAESIGLEKEMRDARVGSGFSFADLAADHAGIRLARWATASPQQARSLQQRLAVEASESLYMPQIENLPEGIHQAQFNRDFSDTRSEVYKQVEQIIKDRIDQLPLYRQLADI